MHFHATPPIVNLNGTARDELARQKLDLVEALRTAREALARAAPNGRDWQTARDPEALARARTEHALRDDVLRLLLAVVEQEHEAVLDQ